MSDIFDETIAAAAESFFLLPGSETVTYYPAAGSGRQITAVVFRPEPGRIPDVEGGSLPGPTVLVRNDPDSGIESDKVNTGGDKVDIGPRVGEPPKTLRITEIIKQDAGLMLLAAG